MPNVSDIQQHFGKDDHERLVATVNPSMSSSTESINDEFQTLVDVGKLNLCYSNMH